MGNSESQQTYSTQQACPQVDEFGREMMGKGRYPLLRSWCLEAKRVETLRHPTDGGFVAQQSHTHATRHTPHNKCMLDSLCLTRPSITTQKSIQTAQIYWNPYLCTPLNSPSRPNHTTNKRIHHQPLPSKPSFCQPPPLVSVSPAFPAIPPRCFSTSAVPA